MCDENILLKEIEKILVKELVALIHKAMDAIRLEEEQAGEQALQWLKHVSQERHRQFEENKLTHIPTGEFH